MTNKISNNNERKFEVYVLYLWAILVIVSFLYALSNTDKTKNNYYDLQIEASKKTKEAFNEIKNDKINKSYALNEKDTLSSYLIGNNYSLITISTSQIQAKITTINPNFGALFIKYFNDAKLKEGDLCVLTLDSSYPALNIALISALETYKLNYFTICSIASTGYGANDIDYTYVDMHHHLYEKGYFSKDIDYYSFEGISINTTDLSTDLIESLEKIENRLSSYNISFIENNIYEKNVEKRYKIIQDECPNFNIFINIGGTQSSIGKNDNIETSYSGLELPEYKDIFINDINDDSGLLQIFYQQQHKIIQVLNIKGIVNEEGLPYNQNINIEIGDGDCYYKTKYRLVIPIITLVLSITILILKYFNNDKKKGKKI